MLQNEVLNYFESYCWRINKPFFPHSGVVDFLWRFMLPLHSVDADGSGCPVRTTFLVPVLQGGATCLPMELEQRSLEKLRIRCFLHTSPFCCLGTPSIVNLEVLCQRWQSQRVKRGQVHELLFGWEILIMLTFLTMLWDLKKKNKKLSFWAVTHFLDLFMKQEV